MTPTVSDLAAAKAVAPTRFEDQPQLLASVAKYELKVPDLDATVERIATSGFFDRGMIEEAFVSLSLGHLMISGPPGTGKTFVAQLLAEAFSCQPVLATANPEWSVFDVIGSQALNASGGAEPRHGVVTSAILECGAAIIRNLDTGSAPQAAWLIIDEINRAEIDRAFGPLFTALASAIPTYRLDYLQGSPPITIPKRFRIIATLNDFDTRFVNSMSGALRRRFARTVVAPPPNEADGGVPTGEIKAVLDQAMAAASSRFDSERVATARAALTPERVDHLRSIFGAVRHLSGKPGLPIGTAQLMDSCTYLLAIGAVKGVPTDETEFGRLIDRVLSVRLIPTLESDSTRTRIDVEFVDDLQKAFPVLERSCQRLRRFLNGEI